ncbi:hypothetical protein [Gloeothece verrucosa]|uniref:Uncharacterized protein n=1 Tax=Gloeothece verrucosa (strain PCC 7822) TaxID=497965 RepID=E0UAF9_GLOV7|nr:hypothetical protein [Gloeothece verrucosa]ADN12700.1 hypothetical protein Cyan7822_0664 [Gloeothece verrucosa PCC 7822]
MSSDIGELIKESNQLILELGWTIDQAKTHLEGLFNKRSRYLLDINEWAEYIRQLKRENYYKKHFPSADEKELLALLEKEYKRLGWGSRQKYSHFSNYTNLILFMPQKLQPLQLKAYIEHLQTLPALEKLNKGGL